MCALTLTLTLALAREQATLEEGVLIRQKHAERLELTAKVLRAEPSGQTIHAALDSYKDHLKRKYGLAGYGKTVRNEAALLKFHLQNLPLAEINANQLELFQRFYESRPNGQRETMLEKRSCANQIKRLR